MHVQGVKYFVCYLSTMQKSRDLGIWATRKHNKSVEIVEKLASIMLQIILEGARVSQMLCFIGHTCQHYPLQAMCH